MRRILPLALFLFLVIPGLLILFSGTASAAHGFPHVVASSIGNAVAIANTEIKQMTLPGSAETDDLIIGLVDCGGGSSCSSANLYIGGNWVIISRISTGGTGVAGWLFNGVPDKTQIILEFQTSSASTFVYEMYRIRAGTYIDGIESATATGSSNTPNPPNLAPSWGAQNTLWIAAAATRSASIPSSYPTDYNDNQISFAGGFSGVAAATRELNAASEDPGVFTYLSSATWIAYTIALRGTNLPPSVRFTQTIVGLTATFDSTVTGGQGALTYAWEFGDGTTSAVADPVKVYAANGQYQVVLTVTDTLNRLAQAWSTVSLPTSGINSLVATSAEAPGVNCADGGIKVQSGLDNGDGGGTASDNILQAGEVDSTSYVCDGADGTNSLISTPAEPPGVNCANGGIKVNSGLDNGDGGGIANDGILQAGEIDNTAYACNGASGVNSLVISSTEPPGLNCANGGVKIDSGLDNGDGGGVANDGILQAGEIDNISYACNGAAGSSGTSGVNSLVTLTNEPAGVNCANGGTRIDSGLDNGDGGGIAADNILQAGEIDATGYACNGAGGGGGGGGGGIEIPPIPRLFDHLFTFLLLVVVSMLILFIAQVRGSQLIQVILAGGSIAILYYLIHQPSDLLIIGLIYTRVMLLAISVITIGTGVWRRHRIVIALGAIGLVIFLGFL